MPNERRGESRLIGRVSLVLSFSAEPEPNAGLWKVFQIEVNRILSCAWA